MKENSNDYESPNQAIVKAIQEHANSIANNLVFLKKFIAAQNKTAETVTKAAAEAAQKSAQAARWSMIATWVLAGMAIVQVLVQIIKFWIE